MNIYKEIHIWDLPTDRVYIKFKDDFSGKFFNLVHQKFGDFNKAGKFLNIKRPDSSLADNWRRGKNCYPLNLMLKLANEIRLPLEALESNIKEIKYKTIINKKGGSSGKPLLNPNLPIIVNEDFAEILGHICGDGTISRTNPNKGICLKYVNSEPTLIAGFQELIQKVFGLIQPNVIVREGAGYRNKNYVLSYPSIISLFVLKIFDYKIDKDMKLPSFIFSMSLDSKARFLRAIFDDESCVDVGRKKILFGLKPLEPVLDIIKLLSEFGIQTGNIHKYSDKIYHKFELANQNSVLLFDKFIGFKHPTKNKKLKSIIASGWKFKRYSNNQPKVKIIEIMSIKGGLEVRQISKILDRCDGTIQRHLENLKKDGQVISYKTQRRVNNTNTFPNVWFIKR